MRILAASFLLIFFSACSLNTIQGDGNVVVIQNNLKPFESLQIGGHIPVIFVVDTSLAYELLIDSNLIDAISFEQNNNALLIRSTKHYSSVYHQLIIYAPFPKHLDIAGAVSFENQSLLNVESLHVSLSGASSATLKCEAHHIHTSLSGSSRMIYSGNVHTHRIDMAGSTKLNALNLNAKHVNMQIGGASFARLHISNQLNVKPSGASRVEYTGTPIIQADDAQNRFIHSYKNE